MLLILNMAGCASTAPVEIAELEGGARVRIDASSAPGEPGEARQSGRFDGYDSQRIYIAVPGRSLPDTIRWEDVRRLRVNTGRQWGPSIVLGMWAGPVAGLGVLHLIQPESYMVGIYFFMASVPAGGLLGGILAPEAWAPVEIP